MFRSPNDITSSDPESSSDEEYGHSSELQQTRDMEGAEADGTYSSFHDGHIDPDDHQDPSAVPNLDPSGHSNFILSSLLEHYCRSQAAKVFAQEKRGKGKRSSEDDAEIETLAKAMYTRLSGQLHDYGIVGQGYDKPELQGVRDGYLQGLDFMLHNSVAAATGQRLDLSTDLSIRSPQGAAFPARTDSLLSRVRKLIEGLPEGGDKTTSLDQQMRNLQLSKNTGSELRVFQGMPAEMRPSSPSLVPASRYASDFGEVRILGKGGYGKVYQAVNHLDGRHYAIKKITLSPKRLRKLQEGGKGEVHTLLRELRTLAGLEHTNVVRYFGGWIETSGGITSTHRPRGTSPQMLPGPSFQERTDRSRRQVEKVEKSEDGGVIFEHSSTPDDDVHTVPMSIRERSASHTTTSSTATKRSAARSVEEDGDDVELISRDFNHFTSGPTSTENLTGDIVSDAEIADLIRGQNELPSPQPNLVLHIQMSLHPVSLSSYLFTDGPRESLGQSVSHFHCFHLQPSLRLTLAILAGVEYLHSQGVVHRDLKPGNVFLALHKGRPPTVDCVEVTRCPECPGKDTEPVFVIPRIGDFGLVAQIARPEENAMDGEGMLPAQATEVNDFARGREPTGRPVGTEFYRPAVASIYTDERLDIFSLGIITLEMLWKFRTKMERHEILSSLNKGQLPKEFSDHIGESSGRVGECIKGMVCPDAEKRWSCKDIRACLSSVLQL